MELNLMDFSKVEPRPRQRLGCCRYDKKTNCIVIEVHKPGRFEYEVDLDRCKTSRQALDWIHQVGPSSKNWGSGIISDFVDILFDYIPDDLWSGA